MLLVARAQSGDRQALDALLRQLQLPLFRHISAIVGERGIAEDVLQDVLITVARKLSGLRDPRWLRAWAFRIASRAAVRRARRERTWSDRDELSDEMPVSEAVSGESLDAALGREEIERTVDALPMASRLVVRMHYFDDLSITEIAEALELPVGTAKSRLAYGLAALRRMLAEHATRAGAARTTSGR